MKKLISIVMVVVVVLSLNFSFASSNAAPVVKFTDVQDAAWYKDSVDKLVALDVVHGYPDGTFRPNKTMTKAEFVTMLVQAMKYDMQDGNIFSDTSEHWARKQIYTALKENILLRSEIGQYFKPDEEISRLDMIVMMCRALGLKPLGILSPFADIPVADGWINRAFEEKLIAGYIENGQRNFKPSKSTIRAEGNTIILHVIEYNADPAAYKEKAQLPTPTPAPTPGLYEDFVLQSGGPAPAGFIQPKFRVAYNTDKDQSLYYGIEFVNILDYKNNEPEKYKFKVECVNYPQLNTQQGPRPDGTPGYIDDTTYWINVGVVLSIYKNTSVPMTVRGLTYYYYTTYELAKTFKVYPGMQVQYKITFAKGNYQQVYTVTATVREPLQIIHE